MLVYISLVINKPKLTKIDEFKVSLSCLLNSKKKLSQWNTLILQIPRMDIIV